MVEADTTSPTDSIRRENPLGKIPTLILDDGETLFDSRVIVQYLDHMAGEGRLVPSEPKTRFAALRLEALADGLADAALLQVYEARWRDENQRHAGWVDHQAGKVARVLATLEASPPGGSVTVGEVALACALGYPRSQVRRRVARRSPATGSMARPLLGGRTGLRSDPRETLLIRSGPAESPPLDDERRRAVLAKI